MKAKDFASKPKSVQEEKPAVTNSCEERSLKKKEMLLSFLDGFGNDIEDLKEKAQRAEYEAIGGFKAIAEVEATLVEALDIPAVFITTLQSIKVKLAEKHNRSLGRKEGFEEIIRYLALRRDKLGENDENYLHPSKRSSTKEGQSKDRFE